MLSNIFLWFEFFDNSYLYWIIFMIKRLNMMILSSKFFMKSRFWKSISSIWFQIIFKTTFLKYYIAIINVFFKTFLMLNIIVLLFFMLSVMTARIFPDRLSLCTIWTISSANFVSSWYSEIDSKSSRIFWYLQFLLMKYSVISRKACLEVLIQLSMTSDIFNSGIILKSWLIYISSANLVK